MVEATNRVAVTREIAARRCGLSGYVDPMLALLDVDLGDRGAVLPPLFPGGHTKIVMEDGLELSLSAFLEVVRWNRLALAQCFTCNTPLGLSGLRQGRRRGPRVDRRYCSNACRQKAYRERLGTE